MTLRILALLAMLFVPLAASAQGAPAAEAFEAGRRAFAEDDYELALSHFRRAFELMPHDNVRFNIAVCLERLGRFREARDEYARAAASTQLDEAARERARTMAERVRARLGTLRVGGRPEGAPVEVAGVSCQLPCEVELDPGAHEIVVRGTSEVRRTAELVRGETTAIEIDATVASSVEASTPVEAPAPSITVGHSPGVLLGIGAVVGALGLGAAIGLGVYTEDLAARYYDDATPPAELPQIYDDGNLARDLTNAAIGVAALGGLLMAIDLIWWAADPQRTRERALAFRF